MPAREVLSDFSTIVGEHEIHVYAVRRAQVLLQPAPVGLILGEIVGPANNMGNSKVVAARREISEVRELPNSHRPHR
jgi:hypothetical protein